METVVIQYPEYVKLQSVTPAMSTRSGRVVRGESATQRPTHGNNRPTAAIGGGAGGELRSEPSESARPMSLQEAIGGREKKYAPEQDRIKRRITGARFAGWRERAKGSKRNGH